MGPSAKKLENHHISALMDDNTDFLTKLHDILHFFQIILDCVQSSMSGNQIAQWDFLTLSYP